MLGGLGVYQYSVQEAKFSVKLVKPEVSGSFTPELSGSLTPPGLTLSWP